MSAVATTMAHPDGKKMPVTASSGHKARESLGLPLDIPSVLGLKDFDLANDIPEKILSWPNSQPALFRDTGISVFRNLIIFIVFFAAFLLLLAIPELIWDEHENTAIYQERLSNNVESYQADNKSTDVDTQKTWFSERMWAYRNLVYWIHVEQSNVTPSELAQGLAQWQSSRLETLGDLPSRGWLHYLYNPGFFWDIMFLLPLSLSALGFAYYALIKHLNRFSQKSKEGIRPYLPQPAAITLLHCMFNRWTAAVCFVSALMITAGNHGTGLVAQSTDNSSFAETIYHLSFPIGFLLVIPFLLLTYRCARLIQHECRHSTDTGISFDAGDLIKCKYGLCKAIFWIAALSTAVAFAAVLMTTNGWYEAITEIQLTPYKPVQRVIKIFFLSFGLLSVVWVLTLVLTRANHSDAVEIAAKTTELSLTRRSEIFDRLILNEINVLEYFGIFSTLTILSYGQSAVFIWSEASLNMQSGLAVLTGLILLSLVLSILPIMYIWYLFIDTRRFNRWARLYKETHSLSETEQDELSKLQNKRFFHAVGLIVLRWRFVMPSLSIVASLAYILGLS